MDPNNIDTVTNALDTNTDESVSKALVLFSGGQDSTTCLAWALSKFEYVETITFSYGQKHSIELSCMADILSQLRLYYLDQRNNCLGDNHIIDLGFFNDISESALTRDIEISTDEKGLPTTFTPGRNLLFLSVAAIVAKSCGIDNIVGGMCQTDHAGYPDCRNDTVNMIQEAINLSLDQKFNIYTPLMFRSKKDTWKLAFDLGGDVLLDLIIHHTHTCYHGDRSTKHVWGYGCGRCPACVERAKGYFEYIAKS